MELLITCCRNGNNNSYSTRQYLSDGFFSETVRLLELCSILQKGLASSVISRSQSLRAPTLAFGYANNNCSLLLCFHTIKTPVILIFPSLPEIRNRLVVQSVCVSIGAQKSFTIFKNETCSFGKAKTLFTDGSRCFNWSVNSSFKKAHF